MGQSSVCCVGRLKTSAKTTVAYFVGPPDFELFSFGLLQEIGADREILIAAAVGRKGTRTFYRIPVRQNVG